MALNTLLDKTEQLETVEARIAEIETIREDTKKGRDFRVKMLYSRPDGFRQAMKFLGEIKYQEYHRRLRQRKRLQKEIRNWKSN